MGATLLNIADSGLSATQVISLAGGEKISRAIGSQQKTSEFLSSINEKLLSAKARPLYGSDALSLRPLRATEMIGFLSSDKRRAENRAHLSWSATMLVFPALDKALRKEEKYSDPFTGITYSFSVPKKFTGAKNLALAVDQSADSSGRALITYSQANREILVQVRDASRIIALDGLPLLQGTLSTELFGVAPYLSKQASFKRTISGPYIGAIALCYLGHPYYVGPHLIAGMRPSSRLGAMGPLLPEKKQVKAASEMPKELLAANGGNKAVVPAGLAEGMTILTEGLLVSSGNGNGHNGKD